MNRAIFQFEVKTWLKSPLFYFLTVCFFLFSLITMLGTGGYFDEPSVSRETLPYLNSPYALSFMSFLFTKLLLFLVAIFAGFSLYRDYNSKTHAIMYAFPMPKAHYLYGKLSSSLFILLLICLITFLGILIGEYLLGTENPKIGTHTPFAYLSALGIYLVPTILTIGTFVFVAVGWSRNIFAAFIIAMAFVLLQLLLENILFGQKELLALLDPFGQYAFQLATENWGIKQQNSTALPIGYLVLFNRIFWGLLAAAAFFIFQKKFDFQYNSIWQFSERKGAKQEAVKTNKHRHTGMDYDVPLSFSTSARFGALLRLMRYDFHSIITNWMFLLLCLLGGAVIFFIQLRVSNTGEFNLLPLTRIFIGAPLSIYSLIIILSTFLFSGFLSNRAKQHQMNLIMDATPIKNWQMIASKVGAITLVQVLQLLLFLLISVGMQVINGYYNFELGLYGMSLFVLLLPMLFVWNLTSHFVHALFPNLFLGLFLLACLWLGGQSLENIGIHTNLLKYNLLPVIEYSDFNGYGSQLKGNLLLTAYWLAFGLFLFIGTIVLVNRGSLSAIKDRYHLSKSRINGFTMGMGLLFLSIFLGLGWTIHKEEAKSVLHNSNLNTTLSEYKNTWEQFANLPSLKIRNIDLQIDIYPEKKDFTASGTYTLINDSDALIDTVLIRTGFDEITRLKWQGGAELLKEDKAMKSYLYKLGTPLAPHDSVLLHFDISSTKNTLFTRNSNVLSNGTYIKQDILPRLGYQFIEHELPLTDSLACQNSYFHRDADLVNIRTRISTSAAQTAIAPGQLIARNTKDGRNHFEYRSPKPVKLNFSFQAADFELLSEDYEDVQLQVFHQKGHQQNTPQMLAGLKAALDYNTSLFGKYPYEQIRIVEFPHTEGSYSATLMANNVPTSEVLFNINMAAMKDKIKLPFYVMAHELTHEWFGNQVMPADAKGAKMLTESITEYLTLRIYQEQFGEEMATRFLEVQKNRYLRGKRQEQGTEQPLYKVADHQEYIAYGKGAIALHTIAEAMGKQNFNAVLQQYVATYKAHTIYPTSVDFIELLKANTDFETHQLIDYWLKEIHAL